MLIGFENGARASFNTGMILGTDTCDRYDRLFVHGSKGHIRSDVEYNAGGELSFSVTIKKQGWERDIRTETVTSVSNYTLEAENMNASIRGRAVPLVTEEFSIKNMKLLATILDTVGYNDSGK